MDLPDSKRSMSPINKLPNTASGMKPAASTIPAAMDQKRKAISRGSLIAVLNLTMESAPTIPRESMILDVTASMSSEVIMQRAMSVAPNPAEYMTPVQQLLYI